MFVALHLPGEARDQLASLLSLLCLGTSGVRWMDPSAIHLTIKFLGWVGEEQVGRIGGRLMEVASGISRFPISLNALGVFPDRFAPRILWVGIKNEDGQLAQLQQRVEESLEGIGFLREGRPFFPHLTLGRVKERLSAEALDFLLRKKVGEAKFEVEEIRLIRSELRPGGSVYTPWFCVPLEVR